MVRPNQYIPAGQLWSGFNPLGVNRGIFVVFRGYIDESYDSGKNVFALSCLISKGKPWGEMERKWKLLIAAKNKQLQKAGRRTISRYHASDCSSRQGEFDGWDRDERDAFVLSLFELFRRFPSYTVVYDVELDDLCTVFPEWSSDRLESAYHLLTGFLMHQIGADLEKRAGEGPHRVTLFHDHAGKYDGVILRAFNQHLNDETFVHRDYFTTIAPLRWQQSIALQPADLVAFECFKEAQARLEARKSRRSYTALLDMSSFGIHSKSFNPKALRALRERMEDQQRQGLVGYE